MTAIATLIAKESGSAAAAGQLGHSSDEVTKRFYIERTKQTQDNSAILGRIQNPREVSASGGRTTNQESL